jgi:hypothetical protein
VVAEFLDRCKAHCDGPPPPSCDIQCEELAVKVKASCEAAGGADCDKQAAEFLAKCKDRLAEFCAAERDNLAAPPVRFSRGDVNRDREFDLSDVIATLNGLFLGTPDLLACEDAADMNDDGRVDISDAVRGLSRLFLGGASLPPPLSDDQDPTADDLICSR